MEYPGCRQHADSVGHAYRRAGHDRREQETLLPISGKYRQLGSALSIRRSFPELDRVARQS